MKYNFNKPLLDLEDKPTETQINKMFSNILSSSPVGNPKKFTYWAKELWAGKEIIFDLFETSIVNSSKINPPQQ